MTIMIIVYKMVVLLMAYCTCTVLLFFVCTFIVINSEDFFHLLLELTTDVGPTVLVSQILKVKV